MSNMSDLQAQEALEAMPSNLSVSQVGTVGNPLTVTLPAVAGQFHYISLIEIELFATNNLSGSATLNTVTTTNLPGNPAFLMDNLATKGQVVTRQVQGTAEIKSAAAGVATTIVCPALANAIWRVSVWYRAGT